MTKERIKHSFKALLKYFYIDIFRASYTHPSLWSRPEPPRGTHSPQSHSPAAFSSPGTLGALHSNPFHGCIPPGRGPAGTRKGGQPPEGLKLLPSPTDTGDKNSQAREPPRRGRGRGRCLLSTAAAALPGPRLREASTSLPVGARPNPASPRSRRAHTTRPHAWKGRGKLPRGGACLFPTVFPAVFAAILRR